MSDYLKDNVSKILGVLEGKDNQECVLSLASSVVVHLIAGSRNPTSKKEEMDRFIRILKGIYEDSSREILKEMRDGNVINMNK